MRNRLITITAALVLASATFAVAQQQTPQPADTTPATTVAVPWTGTLDFGFRPDFSSGNIAQYDRYRDVRDNGAFSRFDIKREGTSYLFTAGARNIGYRDQEYFADFNSGRAKVAFYFDGTPLNYGYNTLTPFTISSGATTTMTLDAATRQAVQNNRSVNNPIVGVPNSAATAARGSAFANFARIFELTSKRESIGFAASVNATPEMAVNFSFQTAKKDGYQPWGAGFAFNNTAEVPLPLDNRTNDFSAGVEWANQQGMMRVAWGASWFNNDIQTLVWDNPVRFTDYNKGSFPYFDTSAYNSTNLGPAQGRMALAPSNNMNVISATGMYKLPYRSTLTGSLAFSTSKQNEALIPWTINSTINSPQVLASWHHLAELPRNTAEAEVRGLNAQFSFNSRPTRLVSFNARYRYNDRDSRTPEFDATEYVRFDAVPEENEHGISEAYDITHNQFDATATFNVMPYTALRVGYSMDAMDHNHRNWSTLTDNTFRVSMDTVGNQYVMVRGQYEFTRRSGSGFGTEFFVASGTQPATRLYDDAERDRNRGTLLFVLTPVAQVDFTASVAAGKDQYTDNGQQFGLLDNNNTSFNLGMNVTPIDTVAFGVNYGRDTFSSTQASRYSRGAGTPFWEDPAKNWGIDADETVNNAQVYFTLIKAIKNTDVSLTYDYTDSDNGFVHSGPYILELESLGQGEQLPNVTNTWQRLTFDLNYFITKNVGFGVGYWYEKFEVNDWMTVDQNGPLTEFPATGAPRVDWIGELSTGYGWRPYKGSTGFFRILYVF
ncbi:MAG TPA: MtrB/PioB family outer membrane beta-barrel protein [Vicinamibacterales bacterium]|nr:MtrB/PioB family outer membrane beta-barrel protein [Vicinamibacterales bacterium]